jgi:thiamine-phosphate pyrophosphorylase
MADTDRPQIYLITPPAFELTDFTPRLAAVLDGVPVACLRLALASHDEDLVARAADACREVAHARDVAIVIETHIGLAHRLGLDGVHLPDGIRQVRYARKELGADAVVGAFVRASRHDGISAAEAGTDYVAFGPAGQSRLGDGTRVDREIFEWWSEMIEVPVVAEGALDTATIADLAPVVDFFGIGEEIWTAEDPLAALRVLSAAIS